MRPSMSIVPLLVTLGLLDAAATCVLAILVWRAYRSLTRAQDEARALRRRIARAEQSAGAAPDTDRAAAAPAEDAEQPSLPSPLFWEYTRDGLVPVEISRRADVPPALDLHR